MGKVFTWQEIASGKIPDKKGFNEARNFIEDGIHDCRWIIGALLCGSVLRGDCNLRSDVDCLVIYQSDHRAEVIALLDHLVKVAKKKYFVPVEFMPTKYNLAQKGMHTIGLGFVHHFKWAAENGGIIKENPLPLMSLEGMSLAQDVDQFIKHKIRELDKRSTELLIMNQKDLAQFLQKVLEAPINLARKINLWKQFQIPDDSKKATIALYTAIADKDKSCLLKRLCRKDRSYSAEVKRQIVKPDKQSYEQTLEGLKSLTSETFNFVEANALWFTEQTKGRR